MYNANYFFFLFQEMAGLVKLALDRYVYIVDQISGKYHSLQFKIEAVI